MKEKGETLPSLDYGGPERNFSIVLSFPLVHGSPEMILIIITVGEKSLKAAHTMDELIITKVIVKNEPKHWKVTLSFQKM